MNNLPQMVSQVFLPSKPAPRHIQPRARPCTKVVLSAEACATLKLNWHEKTEWFKKDLDVACRSLNEITTTLASKHHKSVQRVQNELTLGHVKFCYRHNKVSAWNTFCWKKQHNDRTANISNENGSSPPLMQ